MTSFDRFAYAPRLRLLLELTPVTLYRHWPLHQLHVVLRLNDVILLREQVELILPPPFSWLPLLESDVLWHVVLHYGALALTSRLLNVELFGLLSPELGVAPRDV